MPLELPLPTTDLAAATIPAALPPDRPRQKATHASTDLTREQYAAIMQRVATRGVEEAPGRLDAPRRRTRTPWARKEVIDADSMRLLTRAEARRLLGVRDTGRRGWA